jgi:hypothetical protein
MGLVLVRYYFLLKNSTQAVRRGRQYLHSPKKTESPVEFWYELGLATQKKKIKEFFFLNQKKIASQLAIGSKIIK